MAVLARFTAPWWLLAVLLTAAGCRSGAGQWGPFRGRMVDAESGAPIAGAHVMVTWERDRPNPVHWTQRFYDAQETVTDADGRFEIPRERRFLTLLVGEPRFSAFAPGYVAESEQVVTGSGQLYVDDTVLKMRRLETLQERCRQQPTGIGALFPKSEAPMYAAAVDDYTRQLDCGR